MGGREDLWWWVGGKGEGEDEVVFERDKSNRLLRYVDNQQDQYVAHLSGSGEGSLLMRIINVRNRRNKNQM